MYEIRTQILATDMCRLSMRFKIENLIIHNGHYWDIGIIYGIVGKTEQDLW